MLGANIYKLNIYLQNQTQTLDKPIWQKQGNKGDIWLFGHVFVENVSEYVRFVIEGIVSFF